MTRTTRLGLVARLAAVLCLPTAGAVAVLAGKAGDAAELQTGRAAAVAAAGVDVPAILSYDYRTVDKDVARAKSLTTGLFAQQYGGSASALAQRAHQTRAIVQATASSPGVVSAARDQVVVLLFVDQIAVTKPDPAAKPTTRIDQSRVQVTMTRVGDGWLVSQLSAP